MEHKKIKASIKWRVKSEDILKGLEIVNIYLASSTSFIAFYTFTLAIKLKYFILAFIDLVIGVILFIYFCINLKGGHSKKGMANKTKIFVESISKKI
jgi:hypothetical protein